MNDNDIIKALEHCTSSTTSEACNGCPLFSTTICTEMGNGLQIYALDLINRQKAEIEKLRQENLELKDGYFQKRYEEAEHEELCGLRKAWRKSTDENMILQCEIEGLQKDLGIWKDIATRETSYVSIARTEAIKEFAERLCDGRVSNDPVVIAVKCAVKEMTEDNG